MKYVFPIALVLVLLIVGGVYWYQNQAPESADMPSEELPAEADAADETAGTEEPEATDAQTTYSMSEVAMHANVSSCWTVVNGTVYDLTGWIARHPGGKSAILQLCGTDGTALFTAQHGGQARQESTLAGFAIGTLE